jgi:hypothetical protein
MGPFWQESTQEAVLPLAATISGISPRSGPDDSFLDFSVVFWLC